MKTYNDMRDYNPDMVGESRQVTPRDEDWRTCRTCTVTHHKDDMTCVTPPNSLSVWYCDRCAIAYFRDRCQALSARLGEVYGLAQCEILAGSIAWRRAAEGIQEVLHG